MSVAERLNKIPYAWKSRKENSKTLKNIENLIPQAFSKFIGKIFHNNLFSFSRAL